jgi:hypothetical protein
MATTQDFGRPGLQMKQDGLLLITHRWQIQEAKCNSARGFDVSQL